MIKTLNLREGVPISKNKLSEIIKLNEILICVIFGGYVILIKNYPLPNKNISPVLYNEDLIIFSFLTFYKNQFKKKQIINALSSDHFPIFSSFINNDTFARGSDFWKFNNSSLLNIAYVKKLKIDIEIRKSNLQGNSPFSGHSKWEF